MGEQNGEKCQNNKLFDISPVVGNKCIHPLEPNMTNLYIQGCCIGNTRLTHGYLLKGDEAPKYCSTNLKHIFDCTCKTFVTFPNLIWYTLPDGPRKTSPICYSLHKGK